MASSVFVVEGSLAAASCLVEHSLKLLEKSRAMLHLRMWFPPQ